MGPFLLIFALAFGTAIPYSFSDICYSDSDFEDMRSKYVVSPDLQNWYQALVNCESAGMQLASIVSEKDQEKLEMFLKLKGYNKGYWLSGTDLGNGQYFWVSSGKPVVYTKWLPNQPNNARLSGNDYRGENCIQWGIYDRSPDPAGWNDLSCSYKLPYICQKIEHCN